MVTIKEKLIELINEMSNFEDIKLSDIPCIDLYMDQVTTLFDDKLSPLKRDADEKILTKTMINNYAKAKLLMPIKGKKYSKDQLVLLSLIYNLKQILSLNDLNLILSPIIKNLSLDKENYFLDEIYDVFLHINKLQREELNSRFKTKLDLVSEEASSIKYENRETIEVILTILMLISSANAQKKMAEKIIDKFLKPEK